jgi:hypothetical protein
MEYFWWLYLATRLDAIQSMFGSMVAGSVLVSLPLWMASIDVGMEKTRVYRWTLGAIFAVGVIGCTLVPSKKDAMFIAGGVGVIEASKAIAGSEIAKKSVSVIEQWLANELESLKNKKSDKKE